MKLTRCGFDIAKRVFQVRGVDERGVVKVRKTVARKKGHPPHPRLRHQ